ncbi:MAG: hypothetical protein KDH94_08065, partial [Coxiellaceae bacterium]|nr:hypothetical protein [Coxiellaceae bacterium]
QRIIDARFDRPSLSQVLDKTNHYLNLAAVVAVILAGIAIALASQKYCQRHQNTVALMRCFGTSMPTILLLFTLGLILLCVISIFSAVIIGLLSQAVLEALFQGLINFTLPPARISAGLPAALIGLLLLLGFSLPQLLRLRNVSARQLLHQSQSELPTQNPLVYGSAMVAVTLILLWQTSDMTLLILLMVAFSISMSVMYLLGLLLLKGLGYIHQHFTSAWRLGLLNVIRHRSNSLLHITAFGTTILVLSLLGIIRNDMTLSWQDDLPDNTPNYFLVNVAPKQTDALNAFLAQNAIHAEPLYPIVRGRLTERNDKPIIETLNTEQQQTRALYRDLNLTFRVAIPPGNTLIKGDWWSSDETAKLVSLEEGVANSLGLQLGDNIGFTIAGRKVNADIVNVRKVSWTSFKPNFFMIFTPSVLSQFPVTYMTSFYLPPSKTAFLSE